MESLFSKLVRLGTPVYVGLLLLALCIIHVGLGYVVQYRPTAMPISGLYLKEPRTRELGSDPRSSTNFFFF